ncbi:histidine kinase [Rhodococcus sp. 15-1154-1]|nr:histidine kinase [Rhodococcus sp. 15-1154-1]
MTDVIGRVDFRTDDNRHCHNVMPILDNGSVITTEQWERRARVGALVVATALPLAELTRVAALLGPRSLWIAAVATAIVLPLHLRHVVAALRGTSAPHGRWTLVVMASVALAATAALGTVYAFSLASLVVSCFLVLRPPWSYIASGAAILAGVGAEVWSLGPESAQVGNWLYVAIALMFRATAQLVIIAFAAMLHELSSTRDVLEETAVLDQRDRVEHHLRDVLTGPMTELAAQAHRVDASMATPSAVPAVEITDISRRSRELLERTREVVAGYRGRNDHEQLQAAGQLLRGISPHAAAPIPVSPLEDVASTRRQAMTLLGLVLLPVNIFLLSVPAGLFQNAPVSPTIAGPWLATTAVTVVLGSWAAFDAAAERHSRSAEVRFVVLVAVLLVSIFAVGVDPGDASLGLWLVLPAAAYSLRGHARTVAVVVLGTSMVVGWILMATVVYGLPVIEMVWFFAYFPLVTAVGAGGIYAAASMVPVVGVLSRDRATLAARAIEQENHRVSRDLHDSLGQTLSAISLKGDLALALLGRDRDAARREIAEIAMLSSSLTDDLARVAAGDRAVTLRDELFGAVKLLEGSGIETRVDTDLPVEIGSDADALLGWAVREGATNVLRHSYAGVVTIRLATEGHRVALTMTNDGAAGLGGLTGSRGSGLAGLAERVGAHHGAVQTSFDTGEFSLRVLIPPTESHSTVELPVESDSSAL